MRADVGLRTLVLFLLSTSAGLLGCSKDPAPSAPQVVPDQVIQVSVLSYTGARPVEGARCSIPVLDLEGVTDSLGLVSLAFPRPSSSATYTMIVENSGHAGIRKIVQVNNYGDLQISFTIKLRELTSTLSGTTRIRENLQPLSGVTVTVTPQEAGGQDELILPGPASVLTDELGRFFIDNLPPGLAHVTFSSLDVDNDGAPDFSPSGNSYESYPQNVTLLERANVLLDVRYERSQIGWVLENATGTPGSPTLQECVCRLLFSADMDTTRSRTTAELTSGDYYSTRVTMPILFRWTSRRRLEIQTYERVPSGNSALSLGLVSKGGGQWSETINFRWIMPSDCPRPDDQPLVAFQRRSVTVTESDGTVVIQVVRTGRLDGTASVRCETKGYGSDLFRPAAALLAFAPGDSSKDFTIRLTNDTYRESTTSFEVGLSASEGALLGRNVVTVEVLDDD